MPECPFCKEKIGPNDFLPSEDAACSVCGNRSLVPPSSEPWWVAAAALEQQRAMVAQLAQPEAKAPTRETVAPELNKSETVTTVVAPPPPQVAQSKPILPPRDESADDDEPLTLLDRVRNLDFGSVFALLFLSVALLFCSFDELESFIKPLAGLGLLAGLLGGMLPALWRRRNTVVPFLMSVLCLLVLLFAGSWPNSSPPPPSLVTVGLKQQGMSAHQAAGEDEWVDASANALKRGDVRVEIVSARIGKVDIKRRSSVTSSSERYLMIRLRISYEGILFQQTPYEPWSDRSDSPSKHPPTLTDNQGRMYAQKKFDPGWKVAGQVESDALNPGHQVKDVLIYPIPAREVEHLRLTLPGSAFGLDGAFRFQIPRSMIGGF